MQSLKKIVKAVFAGPKSQINGAELKSPPSREVYAHTQERWIRNFFLRLASLGERNFSLRLIMQEEKVFRNFISFSLRSKEMLASLARNFSLHAHVCGVIGNEICFQSTRGCAPRVVVRAAK